MLNEESCNENSFKSKFKETLKFCSLYHFITEKKEIYYQQEIPQLTCLCEKCEYFELLCEGIECSETSLNLLPTSVCAVLPKFCCNYHKETCAFETCRDCPEFDVSPLKEVDEVRFYQWSKQATKKYPEKSLNIESGPEVLEIFKTQLSILKKHCFFYMDQHKCYKAAKENMTADEGIVHVNFSENYDNKQQHAIQSAYFGYQQFSIYTVAAYHKEGIEKMPIITPDKDHFHVATYHLNSFTLNKLKEKVSSLRKVTF